VKGVVAALAAVAVVTLALLIWRRTQTDEAGRDPVRAQLQLHAATNSAWFADAAGFFALSPDGHYLVYASAPNQQLWLRDMQRGTEEPLSGTEFSFTPFWSPDSRNIGFFNGTKLKKMVLDSRSMSVLCEQSTTGGASWGKSGVILVNSQQGFEAVSPEDGTKREVSSQERGTIDAFPSFLPDGKHFLFVRMHARKYVTRGASGILYLGTLDGSAPRSLDLGTEGPALYSRGFLLYTTQRGLLAQPFDADAGRVTGQPVLLLAAEDAAIAYSASENGVLLSRRLPRETEITLYSRAGKAEAHPIVEGLVDQARFSPDGSRIAYDQIKGEIRDIWIYDLKRRVNLRLTPGGSDYYGPVWSPDGKRIAYSYFHPDRRGVEIRNVDGSGNPETVLETTNDNPLFYWIRSWSTNGDCLFITETQLNGPRGISVQCLKGDHKLQRLSNPKATSRFALALSPNAKWLAYTSVETGRNEVFVQPYPGPGEDIRVSKDGGNFAEWSKDGRELFFVAGNGTIQAVSIADSGSSTRIGQPFELFAAPRSPWAQGIPFASSPDGKLFALTTSSLNPGGFFDLIVNWDAVAVPK